MKPNPGYKLVSAVMATADAFLRESQRLFSTHGLTAAQYNLLNVVAESKEGLSQRALGDRLVVDRSNITGLLDRMERAGWVRRRNHPVDRRSYLVELTPAGRKLWREVTPHYLAVVSQVTHGISGKRMRELVGILQQLETAAGAWTLPKDSAAS